MIFTSYYAKAAKLKGYRISVSVTTPKWADVDGSWQAVKPAWDLVEKLKTGTDETAYAEAYEAQLAALDLSEDIRQLKAAREDVFLLCYEAPSGFCHRHVLARHLRNKYGLEVQEYQEA